MNLRFEQPFDQRRSARFRSVTARQTQSCGTVTVTADDGDGDGGGDNGGDDGTQTPQNGGTQPDPPIPGGLSTVALGGGALLLLLVGFLLTQ